jgi:hypothetical protein
LDASLLRWWDGSTWSTQTMPADPVMNSASADAKPQLAAVPPLLAAVPRGDQPYVPPNSVFRMAEAAVGDAYVPEWSGLVDISDEVALSGVPVQLALTSTPTEPPIPVSADVFPTLKPQTLATAAPKEPVWKVEQPLAAPVGQLFPVGDVTPAYVAPIAPVAPVMAPATPVAVAPVAVAPVAVAPVLAPVAGSLSAAVFPVAAPEVAPVAAPPVPQPAGDAFPGIVPTSAPAPTMFAEPPAPAEPVSPVAPTPAPTPAPYPSAAPEPTSYAGPAPVEVGTGPAAPPDFPPFAASTPGATSVPLAPLPIPQPVQLGASAAMSSEIVAATPNTPVEYWPTQGTPAPGGQYQASPGDYVPFDPNSVRLDPVPVIPFSSRDPFNSASTARPGMRAYAARPVGPSGSTWTGGLAFMLLAPLLSAAVFFVWTQLTTLGALSVGSVGWLPIALLAIGLVGLASAQFDRGTLARRGYFDLASPFWVLLVPPLIYLIVRATRLRGQGKGAAPAIGLWVLSYLAGYVLMGVIAVGWLSAPTPERVAFVQSSIQQELAAKKITATVSCPAVSSFAPGSTFDCSVKTQGATLPIRVTMTDWQGDFTATPVSSSAS